MATQRPATEVDYRQRMLRVLVHLQRHLEAAPKIEELARIANFSPYHFHRVFRGMVGEPVGQYVKRLRLERAALRLRQTSRTVLDLALEAGYESHEGFTRAFGDHFGVSPSAYREIGGASEAGENPASGFAASNPPDLPLEDPTETLEPGVEVRTLPDQRIAFVRHVGPYDRVGEAWEQLLDRAGRQGWIDGSTRMFGACYDDPEVTDASKLRYDACVTVGVETRADGEVGVRTVPGGRFAVLLHEGPYDRLDEAYVALFGRWFPAHRLEPGPPPCFEHYLNEPDCTPPDELLTEIWARIDH